MLSITQAAYAFVMLFMTDLHSDIYLKGILEKKLLIQFEVAGHFISHKELLKATPTCQYVKDNCILVRVYVNN